MRLNDKLEAIIPVGKAVNPITKTNWEGVGVVPDIATSHEESIVKAHELAKVAAQKHGANRRQSHEDLLAMNGKMDESVKNYQNAVDIAKSKNDPELAYFEDHLQKAIEQLGKQ